MMTTRNLHRPIALLLVPVFALLTSCTSWSDDGGNGPDAPGHATASVPAGHKSVTTITGITFEIPTDYERQEDDGDTRSFTYQSSAEPDMPGILFQDGFLMSEDDLAEWVWEENIPTGDGTTNIEKMRCVDSETGSEAPAMERLDHTVAGSDRSYAFMTSEWCAHAKLPDSVVIPDLDGVLPFTPAITSVFEVDGRPHIITVAQFSADSLQSYTEADFDRDFPRIKELFANMNLRVE